MSTHRLSHRQRESLHGRLAIVSVKCGQKGAWTNKQPELTPALFLSQIDVVKTSYPIPNANVPTKMDATYVLLRLNSVLLSV